ncbi:MAG TPA: 4Fe-4S binding protein [Clostridia bacterium]|nr:4Fe-4S binding protein [Clostridia bacterium]
MNTTEQLYRTLQAHLDVMPVAFPKSKSGIEIDILKRFYTEEEAGIALSLSMLPEPARKIHRRLSRTGFSLPLYRVQELLENLAEKKVVNSALVKKRGRPVRVYGKLPFAVGLYEFQVDRLTRGFEQEAENYMDSTFMHEFLHEQPRQMRTIPINEQILPDRAVSRYDSIRRVIELSPGPFALQNCICRQGRELLGQQCRQTDLKQTCLALGSAATEVIKEQRGPQLTKQETLNYLQQAEAEGLVLQAQNTRHPVFICCCCSCCCAILSRAKKLPNPGEFLQSNYSAHIDQAACIGCGLCLPRCPMDALSIKRSSDKSTKGKAVVKTERCIGCGLCVAVCPSKAITLRAHKKNHNPPGSAMEMYIRMLYGRFGFLRATGLLIKAGLGLRV